MRDDALTAADTTQPGDPQDAIDASDASNDRDAVPPGDTTDRVDAPDTTDDINPDDDARPDTSEESDGGTPGDAADTLPDGDIAEDPDALPTPDTGGSDDADTGPDAEVEDDADTDVDETLASPIVSLRVVLPATARAGEALDVTCVAVREDGTDARPFPSPVWATRPAGAIATLGPVLEARRVGSAFVRCGDPDAALPFSPEAEVEIAAGPAVQTTTIPETVAPTAGVPFGVSCQSSDRFGNMWNDLAAFVEVLPTSRPVERDGQRLTLTRSGNTTLTCQTSAETLEPAEVRVQAGPPSSWDFRVGSRPYVRVGFPVIPNPTVQDAYGNEITAPAVLESIRWSTDPPPDGTDGLSFTFEAEGFYTMFGSLDLPGGETSTLERPFLIHGIEPKVACTWPANGEMIEAVPGTTIRIRGTSQDTFAPHSVRVNLAPASFDEEGNWEIDWVVQPGINSYDVRVGEGPPGVLDTWRAWGVQVCSFLAAPSYLESDEEIPDGIVFRLGPDALDDGEREAPPSSLADLLASSVATPQFLDDVDAVMRDSNPLFSGCVQNSPFGCLATATINYTGGLAVSGGSDVQIQPRSSYLAVSAELNTVSLNIAVTSSALSRADAVLRTERIEIATRVRGSIVDGQPSLSITQVDGVTIAPMSATFTGANASTYAAAFSLAEPTLRAELVSAVEEAITDSLDQLLLDAFSGLQLDELGFETVVAPVGDGAGATTQLTPRATGITTDTRGLQVSLATLWELLEPTAEPAPVPLQTPGPSLAGQADLAFGMRIDALNQGFHALWRAGYFDLSLGVFEAPPILGELEDGFADLRFVTALPPQLSVRDGELVLSFGAMRTDFLTRAFQAQGVDYEGWLAADLVATVSVAADGSISVGSFSVANVWGSVKNWDMDDLSIEIFVGFLRGRVETIAALDALDALQGFVLPRFEGNEATRGIGLPPGTSFGIASPLVQLEPNALIVTGVGGLE